MQEYIEIRQLFEAYKAGKQAFPHPVAATTLDIDGEHLVSWCLIASTIDRRLERLRPPTGTIGR